MDDNYAPTPGTATCPACATTIPATVDVPSAELVMLTLPCPACPSWWIELRQAGRVHRSWTGTPWAEASRRPGQPPAPLPA